MYDLFLYFLAYVAAPLLSLVILYFLLKYEAPAAQEDQEPYGEASSYRRDREL